MTTDLHRWEQSFPLEEMVALQRELYGIYPAEVFPFPSPNPLHLKALEVFQSRAGNLRQTVFSSSECGNIMAKLWPAHNMYESADLLRIYEPACNSGFPC